MALSVIEAGTEHNGTAGVVILESDIAGPPFTNAFAELGGGAARNMAIEVAAKAGLADPRCNGMNQAPYATDEKGDTISDPIKQKIHRYRVDISVTRKLV